MRMNSKIITLAAAAAVMAVVTACGSKVKPEEPSSSEAAAEAGTEAVTMTETAEAETKSEDSKDQTDDINGETKEDAQEETTASAAGKIGSDGVFRAASGKFEIKVPTGWVIDDGGDDKYVTFLSADGDDMLEIMNISGSSVESARESYPDTADEYKAMVSRGDGIEILSYNVKDSDDGSQVFQYSMKYGNPVDDIHFLAESGRYDAAKQTYISVTGTVKTTDETVIKQVDEAVKSFKFN